MTTVVFPRARIALAGVVSLLAFFAAVPRAAAAPTDFPAGSWIIPMDACYQPSTPRKCTGPTASSSCAAFPYTGNSFYAPYTTAADGRILSTAYNNGNCPEPLTQTPAKDGITKAYGLIYRLLQKGVPVYYIVQTNTDTTKPPYKNTINGVDLTISAAAATNPVQLLNHTPGSASFGTSAAFMTAGHNSIDYRGAPFIVSAADVLKYDLVNVLKNDAKFNYTDARTGRGVFQDVYIHVAMTNILQAPVRALMNQTPPKLALFGVGGAGVSNLMGYLLDAGLYSANAVARYPSIGEVITEFYNVSDFTNGGLLSGGFKLLWAPHWGASTVSNSNRDAIWQAVSAFNAAGGTVLLQCASIDAAEGSDQISTGSQYGHFMTTATGTTRALQINSIPFINTNGGVPTWPRNVAGEGYQVNPDNKGALWSEPLVQIGDFPLTFTDGNAKVFDFNPNASAYKATVDRMITTTAPNNEAAYKNNDLLVRLPATGSAGQIVYLGGHAYGTVDSYTGTSACFGYSSSQCASIQSGAQCAPNGGFSCEYGTLGSMIGFERLVLNSMVFLGQVPTSIERTRSSPVVYSNGKTYLGTYVQKTQAAAAYPPWDGHFRQYPANALAGTNVTAFDKVANVDWDAATSIAAQSTADSRTILTAIPVSGKLTQIAFTTANAITLGISPTTITAIRKGALGGIDHSIPAVIGPSALAGSPTRPTVAYFGALDGMVHAILVSGTVAGKSPGDELWAFIPNSQLAKTVAQSGGVDGSPSVADVYVDLGSGVRAWRTLLAIPDGNYAGGTIDAIDVTDPTSPTFLWAASDTATVSGKTYVLGRAQGAAMGSIAGAAGVQSAVFIATDNTNGTAGNAFNLYALDAATGNVIWRFNRLYANNTTHNDVPGTVAVIDSKGQDGPADVLFFGDLEGKVWAIPAATGAAANPTPLYDAASANGQANSVNFPIESAVVLYRDPSNQHLAVFGVTGGADWVPPSTLSYAFTVDYVTRQGTTLATLQSGERAFSAPTIYGNAAYLLTSNGGLQGDIGGDFTDAGSIVRINLGASAGVTRLATVTEGASELWVDGSGRVVAASTNGITQNDNANEDKSQATVSLHNNPRPVTVQAWLDLR